MRAEREHHTDTQQTLERVLHAKDEQVADLKEANNKIQAQLEKLEGQAKSSNKTPARPSDRFKVHLCIIRLCYAMYQMLVGFLEKPMLQFIYKALPC